VKIAALVLLAVVPFRADFEREAGDRWPERAAQVWQESRFRPTAENPYSHAKGLAQFMDPTWREMQDDGVVPMDVSPFQAFWAIKAQHVYMLRQERFARRRLPGCDPWIAGLACYNWGPGNWQKAVRRADAAGAVGALTWVRFSPRETQDYIRVIPAKAAEYRGVHG
jgi:hypothetical protein